MKKLTRILCALLVLAMLPLAFASAEDKVTITMWGSDRSNMPFRDGLRTAETLQEVLGINIKITSAPTENLEEKYAGMIASGNIDTVVQYKANKLLDYKDAWVALEDYITEEDTPNLYAVYSDPDIRRRVQDSDGHIRFIAQRTAIQCGKLWFYRQDWMDKLGLEAPKTFEDLYNVFKAIKEGDPNGNGIADEIPFSVRAQGDNKRANLMPFVHSFGVEETFFAEDDVVKFGATDARMKEALTWLSKCYTEGLIDQEYMTLSKNDWYSRWTDGATERVFMGYDWSAYIDNVTNLFKGTESTVNIVGVPPMEGPTGIAQTRDQLQPLTVDEDWNAAIFVGASEEQVKAAMKLFDYAYSEEGMMLLNYGYKGETYDLDENGEPYYTDLIMNNPDGLSAQDALRQYGVQSLLTLRQDARYERAQVTDEVNKTRDLYEQENHIGPAFPTLAFTDDEQDVIRAKYTDIQTYVDETIDAFIMGKKPLDEFDAFAAKVEEMGIGDVLEVYQAAYNRYMGL